jgi:zinc transport system ATP-binding protein
MHTVLSVKDLSFSYDAAEVLSGISFAIDKGDYVALAGPNGSGKTTLAKVILGLESKRAGRVEIFGKESGSFNDWGRIGYLPQQVNMFNPLFPATVKEVVGLGLLSHMRFPKKFTRSDRDKIIKTLDLMKIAYLKDNLVGELSGGQQQRLFLARALVSDPELLILDEPTTALDPQTREDFFALVERLNRDKGVTIIIITHDTAHIGQYAGKLLYLDRRVIFYGGFADFCQSKEMEQYFGHFSQHLICHQHT